MEPTVFHIEENRNEVAWIRDRVQSFRFFEEPVIDGEDNVWKHGASGAYMRRLHEYWLNEYDWGQTVARLNLLPHFRVAVDGLSLHVIHRRSSRPDARALMLAHGWPGSVLEYVGMIDELAEPSDPAAPAFHVILPSLPGYAWSDKPEAPIGPRAVAKLYAQAMTNLGYPHFFYHGGDWGSMVGGWLGLESGQLIGLHLTGFGLSPADMKPTTPEEEAWVKQIKRYNRLEMAYLQLQGTKPQSLAYAMMDSPMGVAAWLAEKFRTWTDRDGKPDEPAVGMDMLLDMVMIYLTTRSFASASWLYRGHNLEGGFAMPKGMRVDVPTAIASFPKDPMHFPPDAMVRRGYNLVQRTDMPRGGHFSGLEAPELLLKDLRQFASTL